MTDFLSLLPCNATEFEKSMEQATAIMENQYVTIRDYWNISSIPVQQMPWLAWEWSVDNWDSNWSEQTKRNMLKDSFFYHRKKGTLQSVQDIIQDLGSNISIKEWWQTDPIGSPYTFHAVVDSGAGESTGVLQKQLFLAIDQSKPVRSHYTLTVAGRSSGLLNLYGFGRPAYFKRLIFND